MGPYGVPGSRDSWTRGSGTQDSGTRDLGSRGSGTRDLGSRDSGSRDLGSRDLGSRDQGGSQGFGAGFPRQPSSATSSPVIHLHVNHLTAF